MGPNPLPFHRAFRIPSALTYLLKRIPELDISNLGLGDEETIRSGGNSSSSSSAPQDSSYENLLRSLPCGRVLWKSKSPSKQASHVPGTRKEPKVLVKLPRSVSFHSVPRSPVSGITNLKHTRTESKRTIERIVLDSESVMKLQKHGSYQGIGTQKNVREQEFLNKMPLRVYKGGSRPEVQDKATTKQKKLVRFIKEPEIIPRSSVPLDYDSSEEPIHGHFPAARNVFKMLKG